MKETLELLNRMQADGIIGRYAIGGAVGATRYLEPAATMDVDVFIALPSGAQALVSLRPVYEYLTAHGCRTQGEHIVIGDWPVQFLAPANPLEQEALAEAAETNVDGVPTHVMTAEHLVAIALNTGRAKDFARILQFLEQEAVDREKLQSVLQRHGLDGKWQNFRRRYLDE